MFATEEVGVDEEVEGSEGGGDLGAGEPPGEGGRHGAGRGDGAAAVGRGGRVLCKIYISPTAVFARCNCSLNIVHPVGIPSAVYTPALLFHKNL